MGIMSNSIKEQKIVGLDPRENLITPLDAVPLVAGAVKIRRGAQMVKSGGKLIQGTFNIGSLYMKGKHTTGLGKLAVGLIMVDKVELGVRAVWGGGKQILVGGATAYTGYQLVHKNSIRVSDILYPKNQSRGLDTSLTSVSKGPGIGTTQRAKRTERTLSPRLSKGDNVNSSSRRQTSYCNLHKKYDFCKYYKK